MERTVVEKRADYLIQVKNNTPALKSSLEQALKRKSEQIRTAERLDFEHGRLEWRSIELAPLSPAETGWPHTHQVARVNRHTQIMRDGEVIDEREEQSLYVGSASAAISSPAEVLARIRGHWHVENGLHHRKDRSMDEDRNRASERGIGRVMTCFRSLAALLLARGKESTRVLQRRLSGKPHLLLHLLKSSGPAEWEKRAKPYAPA